MGRMTSGSERPALAVLGSLVALALGWGCHGAVAQQQAHDLCQEGLAAQASGEYSRAVELFEEALAVYREVAARADEARTLWHIGNNQSLLGNHGAAIAFYEHALSISWEIGDHGVEADSLVTLGNCYRYLWDYQEAIGYYEEALSIFREIEPPEERDGVAVCVLNLGGCYLSLGEPRAAIGFFEEGLDIARSMGLGALQALFFYLLEASYDMLGEYRRSIALHEEALESIKSGGAAMSPSMASLLVSLSLQHMYMGNYRKAVGFAEEVLRITQETGDLESEGEIQVLLGGLFYRIGDYPRMISHTQEALALFRVSGNPLAEAVCLSNLGAGFMALGELTSATAITQDALAMYRDQEDHLGEATCLVNLGELFLELGDYGSAASYAEQALTMFRAAGDLDGEVWSLWLLGAVCSSVGDHEAAVEAFEAGRSAGLALGDSRGNPSGDADMLWRLDHRLGIAYRVLGQADSGMELLAEAVETVETLRGRLGRPDWQASFMREKHALYEELVSLLADFDQLDNALFYVERAKARALVDMMDTVMMTHLDRIPSRLREAAEFSRDLAALEAARRDPPPGIQSTRAGLETAVETTWAQWDAVKDLIREEQPLLSTVMAVDPAMIREYLESVRRDLEAGAVVLEYFVTSSETLLWVVNASGIQQFHRIPVSRSELAVRVRSFRDALSAPPRPEEQMSRQHLELGHDLYELLVAPIAHHLAEASHLLIVPSGVLFYLPFSALYACPGCDAPRGGMYLVEAYSLSYAPSLASLYWPLQRRSSVIYSSVLSLGNPTLDLTEGEKEAVSVAGLFSRGDLLVRGAGTKDRTLELLSSTHYDVLHFSTHGFFDRSAALMSGMALADGEKLYAVELLEFSLGAQLAVLSACQTALPLAVDDAIVAGDELQGLSQALFLAGVPSAVLTLWDVHDLSTRVLMSGWGDAGGFYSFLMGGLSKSEALRQAQIALLKSDLFHHPYYWSPFVLYGNWQ